MLDNVATKQDIERLGFKIDGLRSEIKAEMAELGAGLRAELSSEFEFKIGNLQSKVSNFEVKIVKGVNKLGVLIVAASTTITAVLGGVAALFKFAF